MSKKRSLTDEEIDGIIVAEHDDEAAWGLPVEVKRPCSGSFTLPPSLASRAAFLARLHHARGLETWLHQIIRERVELEELAFTEAKREISSRSGSNR